VPATINGSAGFVTFDDAGISLAFAFDVAADRIAAIYIVRNPDKLRGIAAALAAR
jgi:RNA polymerase sigma-70 factor (ECF subfamily)